MVKMLGPLVLWVLPLVLVACDGTKPPPNDTTAPTVKTVSPLDGSRTITLNTNLVFTFSEAMNQLATQEAVSSTPATSCIFSWNSQGDTLTCDPDSNLAASTTYNVVVGTSAKDLADNALANAFSFSFTTGTKALEPCKFDGTTFNNCAFAS
jgi:hypothetical protein